MHTWHTQEKQNKKKSLKNTKINYTKDLLHLLANFFWEEFASCVCVCVYAYACVLQVSVLASLSFSLYKALPWWLGLVHRVLGSARHLGGERKRHSDDINQDIGIQYPVCTERIPQANLVFWAQTMKKGCPLLCEDKCFICFQTDFFSPSPCI